MKSYVVISTTENGERGSLGGGTGFYETVDLVRYRTDNIARKKILDDYGSDGVRVYHLTNQLRLINYKGYKNG